MSSFLYNAHDLPRRAGEMRTAEITVDEHPKVGVELLAIPANAPIYIDLTLQAVSEGVLVSGEISADAHGECVRCLEPLEFPIEESFSELYRYEIDPRQKARSSRSQSAEIEVGDEDEELWMEGDLIDLAIPVCDAVILNLPVNPLCSLDCDGLCPDCGEKWADLPEGHEHQKSDIRWAGLEGWSQDSQKGQGEGASE
jgi:uncharacterized protein